MMTAVPTLAELSTDELRAEIQRLVDALGAAVGTECLALDLAAKARNPAHALLDSRLDAAMNELARRRG